MEALPPLDYDQLATKTDLEVLARELRADVAVADAGLRSELANVRGDMAANLRVSVAANVGSMMGLAASIVGLG